MLVILSKIMYRYFNQCFDLFLDHTLQLMWIKSEVTQSQLILH